MTNYSGPVFLRKEWFPFDSKRGSILGHQYSEGRNVYGNLLSLVTFVSGTSLFPVLFIPLGPLDLVSVLVLSPVVSSKLGSVLVPPRNIPK